MTTQYKENKGVLKEVLKEHTPDTAYFTDEQFNGFVDYVANILKDVNDDNKRELDVLTATVWFGYDYDEIGQYDRLQYLKDEFNWLLNGISDYTINQQLEILQNARDHLQYYKRVINYDEYRYMEDFENPLSSFVNSYGDVMAKAKNSYNDMFINFNLNDIEPFYFNGEAYNDVDEYYNDVICELYDYFVIAYLNKHTDIFIPKIEYSDSDYKKQYNEMVEQYKKTCDPIKLHIDQLTEVYYKECLISDKLVMP